jgi:hypothetical protein
MVIKIEAKNMGVRPVEYYKAMTDMKNYCSKVYDSEFIEWVNSMEQYLEGKNEEDVM